MKFDLSSSFDRNKAQSYFNKLMKDKAKVEIKKVAVQRSISQNKFLHVCLSIFSKETGFSLEESKMVLSNEFGGFMMYDKDGYIFRTSTSSLDTKQLSEFIDFIRQFSNDQLGIFICSPEDYLIHQFEINKEYNI